MISRDMNLLGLNGEAMQQEYATSQRLANKGKRNFAFLARMIPGIQLAIDSLLLLGVGFASYYGLVYYSYKTVDLYVLAIFANWLLTVMLFHFGGLYQFAVILRPWGSINQIVIAVASAFLMLLAAAFTIKVSESFSRVWVAAQLGGSIGAVIGGRLALSWFLQNLMERHIVARNIAILGVAPQVSRLVTYIQRSSAPFMNISGIFMADRDEDREAIKGLGYPVRGGLDELVAFVRSDVVDDIILALPWSDVGRLNRIMETLRELPANVHLSADLAGFSLPMNPPASYFDTMPVYQVAGKPLSGWDTVVKAVMDYLVATVLLVLLSPLFLVVAVLIKLDSPGPVFFKQKRLGFNNKAFDIYKFRSMRHDDKVVQRTVQATEGDPRITPIGRFLRRTSIDELPQLLNVLNGTMSVVGPRPHAIDHNEDYATRIRGYFGRHRVKPGITGLAQIKGFRGITDTIEKMEQRVKYDIQYTESWSPLLDLKILLMTPTAVLLGKNAV